MLNAAVFDMFDENALNSYSYVCFLQQSYPQSHPSILSFVVHLRVGEMYNERRWMWLDYYCDGKVKGTMVDGVIKHLIICLLSLSLMIIVLRFTSLLKLQCKIISFGFGIRYSISIAYVVPLSFSTKKKKSWMNGLLGRIYLKTPETTLWANSVRRQDKQATRVYPFLSHTQISRYNLNPDKPFNWPFSLNIYTSKVLMVLKLGGYILLDPPPSSLSCPSLKIMHLQGVEHANLMHPLAAALSSKICL